MNGSALRWCVLHLGARREKVRPTVGAHWRSSAMKYAGGIVRLFAGLMIGTAAVASACNRTDRSAGASASTHTGATAGEKYPAPRWPSYFKPPKSVEDLMAAARALVRNQSGLQGKGM